MTTLHLLGLCGSLRRASSHEIILRTAAEELLPAGVRLHLQPLHDIPLYNEDHDGDATPDAVRALREAARRADGVLLGSPEYNHGMSGVIKNTLDWLSRPHGRSPLKEKPVLAFTASPAFTGGVRAQQQLNESFWALQALLVPYPQIVIGSVGAKLGEGRLQDEAARQFLKQGIEAMVALIRRG
ncbi:chromate reductase [Pseudomonas flavescens]|uniref:Chromate reductase n=1 Tax=Phytopseudomonas flavescens TaxID=29435 RepID=A0A1G7X9C5_9GAMM|nr:NAD(P)H-dependent oxidoreductase [Pseudomonas flavescens]SDG80180.1 chromate reductase [Pseudomonas flavescens]